MTDAASPRVFAQPLGSDFPAAVVRGLRDRMHGQPPEAMARVTLIVNTSRMARRIRELFIRIGPGFLPRIVLLDHLDQLLTDTSVPQPRAGLERRLQLARLIAPALEARPEFGARSSVFALADSLARLMDEMQGENVDIAAIEGLDVTDQSGHWANAKALIRIAHTYVSEVGEGIDSDARQRLVVDALSRQWQAQQPDHPIILAGSTGSRGATFDLMVAISALRAGAVILPGVDRHLPAGVWAEMTDALTCEDHPQYRFAKLFRRLGIDAGDVAAWDDAIAPSDDRNRAVSLALRPAPVTDAWLREGPHLPPLTTAMSGVTLLEAPTSRIEAVCIAMRLRQAAEDGQNAALITPDRMLTRQVTSTLDQWNIIPDDSAGMPLHLSPPGRFLRHVADLFARPLDAEALFVLLKHPLTQSGDTAPLHGLFTQELELALRREKSPMTDSPDLARIIDLKLAPRFDADVVARWRDWLCAVFPDQRVAHDLPLAAWVERHRALAERIAGGGDVAGGLWDKAAGRQALQALDDLEAHAHHGGTMGARDYAELLYSVLSDGEVRDRDEPHPGVMIWGTMEARVQGADLVILGGLNDGVWPGASTADPWLNRSMRHKAGLLLPDRGIGLAAHDFQQAVAAPVVWMTRALRSDDAETVPSRWLNRLTNLMSGLPSNGGPDALAAMRARGTSWLRLVTDFERFTPQEPEGRAAPRPPVDARPRDFSVTEIKTLIRDPYAIYARKTLRLRKLDPLVQEPDAQVRGILFHEIMERFITQIEAGTKSMTKEDLQSVAAETLRTGAAWSTQSLMWRAQIDRVADWLIATEAERRSQGRPAQLEGRGQLDMTGTGGKIVARADRIDLAPDGSALLYDYKSGKPPTQKQQKHFDKQLLIEAAMIERGAFKDLDARLVHRATYIGLGATPALVDAPLDEISTAETLAGLEELIRAYLDPSQHFLSRRMLQTEQDIGDFDHLARHGEWEDADPPAPEDLT